MDFLKSRTLIRVIVSQLINCKWHTVMNCTLMWYIAQTAPPPQIFDDIYLKGHVAAVFQANWLMNISGKYNDVRQITWNIFAVLFSYGYALSLCGIIVFNVYIQSNDVIPTMGCIFFNDFKENWPRYNESLHWHWCNRITGYDRLISGPLFTKKTPSYRYMDSHYKPETVVRRS